MPSTVFSVVGISAMYMKYRSGPRTLLCGTPADTSWMEKKASLCAMLEVRPEKDEISSGSNCGLNLAPYSIENLRDIKKYCSTVLFFL